MWPILAAFLLLGFSVDCTELRAETDLFQPTGGSLAGRSSPPLHTARYEPVAVNLDLLRSAHKGARFNLNLLSDVVFVADVERAEVRPNGGLTVAGTLDAQPDGGFILVVEDDVVMGTIRVPTMPRVYQLRYRAGGEHLICEMDPDSYPPCKGSVPPDDTTSETGMVPPSELENRESVQSSACNPLQPVFDVLVLYTPLARQRAGGYSAINALCQLAIEESNQAYQQSQIDARMRLVYRNEINYTEGDGYDAYLNWVKNSSTVHDLRDSYAADFVSLLVDDSSYCGLGQCYNGAYTTCAWHCATGYYSFSHEIGHNQGCDHDRENAGASGCSVYGYSYGWRFNGSSGTEWRTIMAYSPGTRIQYFSNPYVFYDGARTGVPIGDDGQSYNAMTIINKTSVGETKRNSRFDVWVQFPFSGTELGTYGNPYNTIAEGLSRVDPGYGASELPTLWIKNGSSAETAVLNKRMIVRPCGGSAILGRAVVSQQ